MPQHTSYGGDLFFEWGDGRPCFQIPYLPALDGLRFRFRPLAQGGGNYHRSGFLPGHMRRTGRWSGSPSKYDRESSIAYKGSCNICCCVHGMKSPTQFQPLARLSRLGKLRGSCWGMHSYVRPGKCCSLWSGERGARGGYFRSCTDDHVLLVMYR